MKANWNGATIAQSASTTVVDGNHYFPRESIRTELLEDSKTETHCGWKGTANYFHIVVNGDRNEDAAWIYHKPLEAAKEITGMVAFWKGVEVVES